jgi:hypothetical protein
MKMLKTAVRPAPSAEGETPTLRKALPAAPPAALQQAQALGTLVGQSAARSASNGAAVATVLTLAGRVDTWSELQSLQGAVLQRVQLLQRGWLQGWTAWLHEFADLKRANTMSEHLEQQYNLVAQAGELLKDQATDLLSLQENVEVDCGYWVAQKLRELQPAPRSG